VLVSESASPPYVAAANPFPPSVALPEPALPEPLPAIAAWGAAMGTAIIVGDDERVAEWVRQHLPEDGVQVESWGNCRAIGIVRRDSGELIAGIVYTLLIWPSIEASIASISARWCSRRNLAAIFAYPFWQLRCRRLGATTSATNQPVQAFLCRLGFRHEGTLRQFLPEGDAVIYGLTAEECRWLPRS
jgi:RimJ/RimL family protein N-acetyltransferase